MWAAGESLYVCAHVESKLSRCYAALEWGPAYSWASASTASKSFPHQQKNTAYLQLCLSAFPGSFSRTKLFDTFDSMETRATLVQVSAEFDRPGGLCETATVVGMQTAVPRTVLLVGILISLIASSAGLRRILDIGRAGVQPCSSACGNF